MKNSKRILAAAAALLFAAALFCSLFAAAACADHDCPGEGCRLCLVQQLCEKTLKLTGIAVCALSLSALVSAIKRICCVLNADGCAEFSPVKLKTKLLN